VEFSILSKAFHLLQSNLPSGLESHLLTNVSAVRNRRCIDWKSPIYLDQSTKNSRKSRGL